MKYWRKLFTDAPAARESADEIERLRVLLTEAAWHLRRHAEEYQHPGQPDLISRIETHLSRK